MRKLLYKIRNWLIRLLGGVVIDDIRGVGTVPDYWERYYASESLYVSKDTYMEENADSIETELAERIGRNMLRNDCIFLSTSKPDEYGDITIMASVNVLRLRKREPYHMPCHLKFRGENHGRDKKVNDRGH